MASQIFLNLPVKDLNKSVDFWTKLGFTFNPQFTDENATCMIVSDSIFVMLLVEKFFRTFTTKQIADSSKTVEAITALSVESKAKVDEMVEIALKSGGSPSMDPQDHGWMYSKSFQDPDGHIWEILWADPAGIPQS